jgi:hypothetical protein
MTFRVICPACNRSIRAPEHLAGRRVTCPRCGEAVRLPSGVQIPEEGPANSAQASAVGPDEAVDLSTPSQRLGFVAALLGLGSVLVLCLPVVGYVSIVLSTVGLILGLAGLVMSSRERRQGLSPPEKGGQALLSIGGRRLTFPAVGVAVCLLALILVLLPLLLPGPSP